MLMQMESTLHVGSSVFTEHISLLTTIFIFLYINTKTPAFDTS